MIENISKESKDIILAKTTFTKKGPTIYIPKEIKSGAMVHYGLKETDFVLELPSNSWRYDGEYMGKPVLKQSGVWGAISLEIVFLSIDECLEYIKKSDFIKKQIEKKKSEAEFWYEEHQKSADFFKKMLNACNSYIKKDSQSYENINKNNTKPETIVFKNLFKIIGGENHNNGNYNKLEIGDIVTCINYDTRYDIYHCVKPGDNKLLVPIHKKYLLELINSKSKEN